MKSWTDIEQDGKKLNHIITRLYRRFKKLEKLDGNEETLLKITYGIIMASRQKTDIAKIVLKIHEIFEASNKKEVETWC